MKAVQLGRFGGPEVLQLVDVPAPVAGPGELVVRVRAAGVNLSDTLMRANRYPVTPASGRFQATRSPGRWWRWGTG